MNTSDLISLSKNPGRILFKPENIEDLFALAASPQEHANILSGRTLPSLDTNVYVQLWGNYSLEKYGLRAVFNLYDSTLNKKTVGFGTSSSGTIDNLVKEFVQERRDWTGHDYTLEWDPTTECALVKKSVDGKGFSFAIKSGGITSNIEITTGDNAEQRTPLTLTSAVDFSRIMTTYCAVLSDFSMFLYQKAGIDYPTKDVEFKLEPSVRIDKGWGTDMLATRRKINPPESRTLKFEDVGGLTEAKNYLRTVIDFLKHPEKYQMLGAEMPKGVLLYGPPGNGKTILARAVAGEAGVNFFNIQLGDIIRSEHGRTSPSVELENILKYVDRMGGNGIIFLDEFDSLGTHRGYSSESARSVVTTLLTYLDGFNERKGFIIASSNLPNILDPALLRPGRIEERFYVKMPNRFEREEILKIHMDRREENTSRNLYDEVDINRIAKVTRNFSGAQLNYLLNRTAIRKAEQTPLEKDPSSVTITTDDIVAEYRRLRKEFIERGELKGLIPWVLRTSQNLYRKATGYY